MSSLQLGSTATTVEVTAAAPLLNSESASLGTVVTNKEIVNLPLNGRSFYDLAKLTPGAATASRRRQPAPHPRELHLGHRHQRSARLANHVPARWRRCHRPPSGRHLIQTSIDALQEFSVQQNAYSAEFGSAGGILNMTYQIGRRTSFMAACSNSCATTIWTRATSSRPSARC